MTTWFPVFRVWDIKNQQMWFQEKNLEFGIAILQEVLKDRDRFVLMQWTGIYDVNNNMIFEGDILEGFGVIEWYVNRKEGYCGWTFVDLEKGERHDFWYLTSDLRIIGNRHQDPEMYEESAYRKTRKKTEKFIEDIKNNPGKVSTISATNGSGTLWEQMWKFINGEFYCMVVSPGYYGNQDWNIMDESSAMFRIDNTFRTVEEVRR